MPGGYGDRGGVGDASAAESPLPDLTEAVPVFDVTPAQGEPARFGFEDSPGPDHPGHRGTHEWRLLGVSVNIRNTTQAAQAS